MLHGESPSIYLNNLFHYTELTHLTLFSSFTPFLIRYSALGHGFSPTTEDAKGRNVIFAYCERMAGIPSCTYTAVQYSALVTHAYIHTHTLAQSDYSIVLLFLCSYYYSSFLNLLLILFFLILFSVRYSNN